MLKPKSNSALREKSSKNSNDLSQNPLGGTYYTLQKIYNFLGIKLFNIISIIFTKNDDYYNSIFLKIKFGFTFAELIKLQYEILNICLDEENVDISILDNYMVENRIRLNLFSCILSLSKKYDEIKLQLLQSEVLQFMFEKMISDFRKFKTRQKKLSLEFEAKGLTTLTDEKWLGFVLEQLISNAIKYTNPGGIIAMRITQKHSSKKGIANYEFRVKDTGIGMSKEYLKTIFEPFSCSFIKFIYNKKSKALTLLLCWDTRTRTRKGRTRICSVTITPYPNVFARLKPLFLVCECKGTNFFCILQENQEKNQKKVVF